MIERASDGLKKYKLIDQAAYQPDKGTTEQVYAVKVLAKKAITKSTTPYTYYYLMCQKYSTELKNRFWRIRSNARKASTFLVY